MGTAGTLHCPHASKDWELGGDVVAIGGLGCGIDAARAAAVPTAKGFDPESALAAARYIAARAQEKDGPKR